MSPLLRRSELPPIDLSRELDAEAADLFSLVVISPCQIFVSNDPSTNEAEIFRTPCNITSFECFETLESDYGSSSSGPSEVVVKFDYELWYSNPNQFNLTVVQLESSMLQHMAKVFGLLDCPTVAQTRGSNRGLQVFSQEIADLFVGVDSTPVDVADMNNTDCIVPVQTSDKVDATCQPMTGYFTASVNADLAADSTAEASVRSGLLRLLRLGMKENLYLNGDVRQVSFIGDRTDFVPPPVQTQSSNSSSVDMGTVALTCTILAAFLAFLIGGFLIRKTVRKRKQEQGKGMMLEEDFQLDADEASYNMGFVGDVERNGSGISLASTDELALESQDAIFPILTPKSDGSADEAKSEAPTESTNEIPGAAHAPSVIPTNQYQVAAVELDILFLSTEATPSSDTSPERDTSPAAKTSPKKKKKKKRKKTKKTKTPDSPDSLLAESLKTLDSIAEEPSNDSSEFEDSDADSESARSLT